jgi:hypothetical protein
MKSLRTGVAAAMGGAVLVGGLLLGASIAMAQTGDQPTPSDQPSTTADDSTDDSTDNSPENSPENGDDEVRRGERCGNLEEIAEELGIDLDELRQQLDEGTPLRDLLEDAGLDPDAFVEGFRFRGGFGDRLPFLGRHDGWLDDLDIDIDLDDLREKIESGLTLEEALGEFGVDIDSLLEEVTQGALDKIDELLADGVITDERAAELREMVEGFELGEGLHFGPGFRFEFDGSDGPGLGRHHGEGFGFFDGDGDGDDDEADESSAEDVLLDV